MPVSNTGVEQPSYPVSTAKLLSKRCYYLWRGGLNRITRHIGFCLVASNTLHRGNIPLALPDFDV